MDEEIRCAKLLDLCERPSVYFVQVVPIAFYLCLSNSVCVCVRTTRAKCQSSVESSSRFLNVSTTTLQSSTAQTHISHSNIIAVAFICTLMHLFACPKSIEDDDVENEVVGKLASNSIITSSNATTVLLLLPLLLSLMSATAAAALYLLIRAPIQHCARIIMNLICS